MLFYGKEFGIVPDSFLLAAALKNLSPGRATTRSTTSAGIYLGNMTSDSSKGLQFCYNFANLPSKVEGMAGSANAGLTLSYGYLSDGTKTSAVIGTGNGAEGLKYRGAFVYELKDGVERIGSASGRSTSPFPTSAPATTTPSPPGGPRGIRWQGSTTR